MKNFVSLLVIFYAFLAQGYVYASEGKAGGKEGNEKTEESRIEPFKSQYTIAPYFAHFTLGLAFQNPTLDTTLTYETDDPLTAGMKVGVNDYELAISTGIFDVFKRRQGQSFKFNYDYYGQNFSLGIGAFATDRLVLKGITRTDSSEEADLVSQQASNLRSDLLVTSYNLTGIYLFSPEKFSLKSALTYAERQKRSGGSALLGFNVDHIRLKSSNGLFNEEGIIEADGFANLNRVDMTGVSISGGYGFTWVFRPKWNLTVGGLNGLILQRIVYRDDKSSSSLSQSGFDFRTFNSLGYNGDNFFCGFAAQGWQRYSRVRRQVIGVSGRQLYFFSGTRF
ncbi:MAG: DUF4421 family protein [Oligoflexales bacterium]